MKTNSFYIILFLFFCVHYTFSQEENNDGELKVVTEEVAVKKKKKKNKKLRPYEPLAPARAAFYSAILPGLGQAYNGKYWKIPIVYGALGAGVYFYKFNNDQYTEARDFYKNRLAGLPDDINNRLSVLSNEQLIDRQRRFKRDQELSILITVGLYVLNIIDANVTAHLQQFNVSKDLSFKPNIHFNEFDATPSYGMSLNYSF
ncbi:DUF5683 domain-containing protein [Aquimarina sp. 2201CG14-23]|uniref:DUF5683 domain-containing protein n=1 Tax=Aquimarina mycalae TaxID=3040073 RepID=UPI002477DADB|nr:DUF5683 domain-containing protein [Aquimarina sp. 2201CG14-23]MDH7444247.1 DUF5683 domain-containing protein [Aquimarina sp. 2201CG14-23]